jgi:hypothetical protein
MMGIQIQLKLEQYIPCHNISERQTHHAGREALAELEITALHPQLCLLQTHNLDLE